MSDLFRYLTSQTAKTCYIEIRLHDDDDGGDDDEPIPEMCIMNIAKGPFVWGFSSSAFYHDRSHGNVILLNKWSSHAARININLL